MGKKGFFAFVYVGGWLNFSESILSECLKTDEFFMVAKCYDPGGGQFGVWC